MFDALQRPVGPLPAWGWGAVIVGGYIGYRILSGKGLSGGGSSSDSSQSTGTPIGGSVTQGPQGDPGPPGPPGPPGAPGGATGGTSGSTTHTPRANFIASLDQHLLHLFNTGKLNAGNLDPHQLHLAKVAKIKIPAAPIHPAALAGSSIKAPSTTQGSQPYIYEPQHPAASTAVSVSSHNVATPTIPIKSQTPAKR